MDDLARAIELLDNLTPEDRLAVLRHYHRLLTEPEYLTGGGMATGPMVLTDLPEGLSLRLDPPPLFP